jgi:hypothetical protein
VLGNDVGSIMTSRSKYGIDAMQCPSDYQLEGEDTCSVTVAVASAWRKSLVRRHSTVNESYSLDEEMIAVPKENVELVMIVLGHVQYELGYDATS